MIQYLATADHLEWIREVVNDNSNVQGSARFMVDIVGYSGDIRNAVKLCSGVIINYNSVLTTASCVNNVPNSQQIGIRFINPTGSTTTANSDRVITHPNYNPGQKRVANIAVVRVIYIKKNLEKSAT